VILDADDHHEIELPGHRVRFRDAWDIGERGTKLGDRRPLRLDQHDGGDHEGDSLTSAHDVVRARMVINGRPRSDRLFRLVVYALAQAFLPGEAAGARAFRVLRAALQHGRTQQLLLSTAAPGAL